MKLHVILQSEVRNLDLRICIQSKIYSSNRSYHDIIEEKLKSFHTFSELLHKFAIKLETKHDRLDYIEGDIVEFKLECEEDDAEVKWFKDGVEIIPDGKR